MVRVYISSTFRDLKEYRSEVYRALRRMRLDVVAMEDMNASHLRPRAASLQDLEGCQIYIGIFAWRYGFIPTEDNPEQRSITELEFRHAEATGRTCLIFLLDENAPWLPGFIDRGKAGEQIRQLRSELEKRFVCAYFTSADDLAAKVATAVARALQTMPGATALRIRAPKLGPVVPKKCDRHDQEEEFSAFFSVSGTHCPDRPKFVIIHGDEGEKHRSLVERFIATAIQPHVNDRYGVEHGAVSLKRIPDWPLGGELNWRSLQVFTGLFNAWDAKLSSKQVLDVADKFGKLITQSPARALAIQHNVYLRKWDKTTIRLVKRYMEFWDLVRANPAIPEVFIFLNVIYQLASLDGEGFSWGSLMRPLRRVTKWRIKRALLGACDVKLRSPQAAAQGATCPGVMLTELSCVKQNDVWKWFEEHDLDKEEVEGFRRREIRRIFETERGKLSKCRSMSDIEPNLYRIVKLFEPEVENI